MQGLARGHTCNKWHRGNRVPIMWLLGMCLDDGLCIVRVENTVVAKNTSSQCQVTWVESWLRRLLGISPWASDFTSLYLSVLNSIIGEWQHLPHVVVLSVILSSPSLSPGSAHWEGLTAKMSQSERSTFIWEVSLARLFHCFRAFTCHQLAPLTAHWLHRLLQDIVLQGRDGVRDTF